MFPLVCISLTNTNCLSFASDFFVFLAYLVSFPNKSYSSLFNFGVFFLIGVSSNERLFQKFPYQVTDSLQPEYNQRNRGTE